MCISVYMYICVYVYICIYVYVKIFIIRDWLMWLLKLDSIICCYQLRTQEYWWCSSENHSVNGVNLSLLGEKTDIELKPSGQEKFPSPCFCSSRILNGLCDSHPHWGEHVLYSVYQHNANLIQQISEHSVI